jgi:hypothetical protein
MPESDDKDLQPTFGGCHGETLPESERMTERKPRRFRKYNQPLKPADEEWWENAMRNGASQYRQSQRTRNK